MDVREEVREFLRSRRDRLTPDQVGLAAGGRRRVPGLRRDDVAVLAGMSIDYYTKIEQGNLAGVSVEVLDSLARALRLDESETEHLHDLARAASSRAGHRGCSSEQLTLRPSQRRLLDAITGAPAWVVSPRSDIVATNHLGRALLAPILDEPANRRNIARFIFLSPAAHAYFPEWEAVADVGAAALRFATGRYPADELLDGLVSELFTRSEAFRLRWPAHDVRLHLTGIKRIHHPDVGDLEFTYEGLELPDSSGWMLFTYTTAAGSISEERMRLLGSLAATGTELSSSAVVDG